MFSLFSKGMVVVTVMTMGVMTLPFVATAETTKTLSFAKGSKGSYVYDIQHRLHQLGHYKGPQHGNFDNKTEQAVETFQRTQKLPIDGEVDRQTLNRIWDQSLTKADVDLLAKAVHSESRGETMKGKVAVAAVILNRVDSKEFPDSIRGVVYQKRAFTAVEDGQINLKPNQEAYNAVYQAIQGQDPTNGAIYYYNPKIATSKWMKQRAAKSKTTKIGDHVFMK
ncbi:cell wall hydrolase [Risungbinella massiliensis]|uniref:cell wall hydrolase n=1 Tax=Risungbinella massiliensis TaxID=1329796 RepID=UPI00069C75EA|nr:cell wall hydrolase [Risungbinella massiliensis]